MNPFGLRIGLAAFKCLRGLREGERLYEEIAVMHQKHETTGETARARNSGAFAYAVVFASAFVVVAASQASAQTSCSEGSVVCGFVWNDLNDNGIQDAGEPGLDGVTVSAYQGATFVNSTTTDQSGHYGFSSQDLVPSGDAYQLRIDATLMAPGTQVSPQDQGNDDTIDSDGIDSHTGLSYVNVSVLDAFTSHVLDFGFFTPRVTYPGTGTPGYWKNHPEAWPVSTITVGGVTYTKAQAIAWLGKVGKDKTTTMFSSLVPAMLNVTIGNPDSCVASTISAANVWMATYGPVGSNVPASSPAWAIGEPLHQQMDAYNNGLLCAPHRN